jgi:dTDP-4-amino-4,6-dideoxyglucose formyltransferase
MAVKILVVWGNRDLMVRTKPIFDRYACEYSENDISKAKYYDLVFSLHCKVIFPLELVSSVRCINIHPGYSPYNRGMFPHVWSIINGLPAGATIHEMDNLIDHGRILVRTGVQVLETDTSESLYKRVIETEVQMLSENIDAIINNRVKSFEPEEPSNYNSMEDYKKLCQIDPEKAGTFIEFYNLLRALSHGEHRNAIMNDHHLKLNIYD